MSNPTILAPLVAATLGGVIALAIVPLILRAATSLGLGRRAADIHHTHRGSIPRLGGLALASAFIALELFVAGFFPDERAATPGRNVVVLSSLAMFVLGFWDDLRPLGAKRKLLGQVGIALAVWISGIGIEEIRFPFNSEPIHLHSWSALVTVLWLVGMTNLINLIDGADGLAGGISVMLLGLIAYIGHQSGHFELLASGMVGALIGFLRYNFPPARIYLGDGGAYFLGFLIGVVALVNSHKGTIFAALVAPLFVLALPIVDTGLAILRRGMRGLPIFRPDRRHIHHRLLSSGLSRRQVVLAIYGFTMVFLVLGLMAFWSSGKLVPVLLGVAVLIFLVCAGNFNFSREWFSVGRVLGNSLEMRKEVQYALSLTGWLGMEGARDPTLSSLWEDLVFAAKKLGACGVKVKVADGERAWSRNSSAALTSYTHELQGGRLGILEISFPVPTMGSDTGGTVSMTEDALYEILSELLAEGWLKACTQLKSGDPTPLCFNVLPQPAPSRAIPRHSLLPVVPAHELAPREEGI